MAAFSSCCCFFLLDALLLDWDTCALTVTILLVVAFATIVPDVVELTIGVVATLPPPPLLLTELKEFMFDDDDADDWAELVSAGAAIAAAVGVEMDVDDKLEFVDVNNDTPVVAVEAFEPPLPIDDDAVRLLVWDIGVVVIFAFDVRVGAVCCWCRTWGVPIALICVWPTFTCVTPPAFFVFETGADVRI